ncbi:hypothetical protein [Limnoglobus roseus]|uniref:Uncharacterized protein n=1 Tax=Limnoglobus roseus TaxID=2598579 RepID=A0A5C1ASE9_9BACT|nr:hypothetical protein [Limnoglobus roseus]QEL19828.1 hypothetical protein PX52LOC_06909 [Limnoglobus roseus]
MPDCDFFLDYCGPLSFSAEGYDVTAHVSFPDDAEGPAVLGRLARSAKAQAIEVEYQPPGNRALAAEYADVMRAAGFSLSVDESRGGSLVWVPDGAETAWAKQKEPKGAATQPERAYELAL